MDMKDEQWVWVLVHGPEGNEQLLGQQDVDGNVSFIPCFLGKDEAANGLAHLNKERSKMHTVQAIIFEDLKRYAEQNGFMIFVIDAMGNIIERIGNVPR
ncbi:MAG: hypothetical protein RBT11_17085 [Desulfobacterales bacterium]|jgi:hypothetical protein|nr:hypothetical protein [Desulfobacterales bacterium]